MKKVFFIIIVIFAVFISCEKDDICNGSNNNTPHLIIRFYDITDPGTTKTVDDLSFIGEGISNPEFSISTIDSIAIPLKTLTNSSAFRLIKNATTNDNGTPDDSSDDFPEGNDDLITITYTNEEIFISRACGFKSIFNNTTTNTAIDADNWILNTEVINPKIENEENAHIHIFH